MKYRLFTRYKATKEQEKESTVNRGDFGQICTIFINIFIMMNEFKVSHGD